MVLETYEIKVPCRYDSRRAFVCQFRHRSDTEPDWVGSSKLPERDRYKQGKLN